MSEAKTIKIGIMGCKRGGPFVGIFRTIKGVEVPCVCETDPETVESIKKRYPDVKVYSDFNEFIDKYNLNKYLQNDYLCNYLICFNRLFIS